MKYVYLLSLLLSSSSLFSMSNQVAYLNKWENNFHVVMDDKKFVVPNHLVSKTIREVDTNTLNVLLNNGSAYLALKPYSNGQYALDIKGRVKGGGWAGATIGAAVGWIVVPAVIVLPSAAALYATKAAIHIKAGPEAGELFQRTVINNAMPKITNFACNVGNVVAAPAAVAGGVLSGPA